jgi:hypothetical protein
VNSPPLSSPDVKLCISSLAPLGLEESGERYPLFTAAHGVAVKSRPPYRCSNLRYEASKQYLRLIPRLTVQMKDTAFI